MLNLIGRTIDRYRILEQVGVGGMAIVHKAYDTRLERDVAIKIIRSEAFPPNQLDRILKRFEREAKALGRLSHPNIIKVIDYGQFEGAPFLVMEYLAGGTLKKRLGSPIQWQNAVRLLLPITAALEYAHEQKIIHRDIKPSNILLTQKGQPLLTDFGIAKILETDETFTLTGTGIGVGTPEYMSPEQWTGSATAQSDIYSLGVVLYEMVTGRKPYTADTPAAILLKQATEPLPRPSKYVSNLPESIEKILLKALASNLKVRYQDVGALINGLENLLAETSKSSRPIAVALPIASKSSQSEQDTRDTFSQEKSYSTKTQTVTYDEARGGTRTTQTMNFPAKTKKKVGWWPWAIGFAGMGCITLVGATIIGGGLLTGFFGPIATSTPVAIQVQIATASSAPVEPSILAQNSETPTPSLPRQTSTSTLNTSSYPLKLCNVSTDDICLYSISPQPTGLIISFKFKKDITNSNMPQLTVANKKFECELLAGYPGRLFCNGSTFVGNATLVLISSTNERMYSGNFNIPQYTIPTPTKSISNNNNDGNSSGSGGGSTYP